MLSLVTHRLLEVAPERLERWAAGFAERHGAVGVAVGESIVLTAADGAVADFEVPFGPVALGADPVGALAAHAGSPRSTALLLVRRGGYGVGVARGSELLQHKVGTKYVQSRTAAGGWSQQRFARRRTGQAAGLVLAAVEAAVAMWGRGEGGTATGVTLDVLVPGGDRLLVEEALGDPRLAFAAALPRGPLLDVRDPRLDVLRHTAKRCRSVRVRLTEPDVP